MNWEPVYRQANGKWPVPQFNQGWPYIQVKEENINSFLILNFLFYACLIPFHSSIYPFIHTFSKQSQCLLCRANKLRHSPACADISAECLLHGPRTDPVPLDARDSPPTGSGLGPAFVHSNQMTTENPTHSLRASALLPEAQYHIRYHSFYRLRFCLRPPHVLAASLLSGATSTLTSAQAPLASAPPFTGVHTRARHCTFLPFLICLNWSLLSLPFSPPAVTAHCHLPGW